MRRRLLGLVAVLVLVPLGLAGLTAAHDHSGHGPGVYDDQCPLRVAGLCGVSLPAVEAPSAPCPLPAVGRPVLPARAGFFAPGARSLRPRAPPSSSVTTPTA